MIKVIKKAFVVVGKMGSTLDGEGFSWFLPSLDTTSAGQTYLPTVDKSRLS